jgi:DNA processing protein
MDSQYLRQCLLLHGLPHFTDNILRTLLLHYGGPAEILRSNPADWRQLSVPAAAQASARLAFSRGRHPSSPADPDQQLDRLQQCKATIIHIADPVYPALLRAIHDPPPLLYVRGDAQHLQQALLAVVGSRKPTPAGLRAAGDLSALLVEAGLHVCSGLAIGIDGAAHRGALDGGGATVAVMATGIETVYPARHRALAAEIVESGCLVSEFPPGMPPLRENFPRRNRVVTGLSLGTLVVEAALPSGSLISATSALEQGREVFALPWSVYHAGGRGCLRLLRDGARMVLGVEDILAELGPLYGLQQDLFERSSSGEAVLAADEKRILDLVGYEMVPVDTLVQMAALPVPRVLAELSALELKGLVVRCEGGYIRS